MIFDRIEHADYYSGINAQLSKALDILKNTDFNNVSDGKYVVDGDSLFYTVMTYQTKIKNDTPESHIRYIDIQYAIEGEEYIGVAPLHSMKAQLSENITSDIYFWTGECSNIKLSPHCFAILFPQDAHAPGIAVNEPETIRKVVVKVQVPE